MLFGIFVFPMSFGQESRLIPNLSFLEMGAWRIDWLIYWLTYCYGLSLVERYKARFSNIIHYMSNYHFSGAIYIFNCHGLIDWFIDCYLTFCEQYFSYIHEKVHDGLIEWLIVI
jgi:hypothetical protein